MARELLPKSAKILVFIGPSGSGKSSLIELLVSSGLLDFSPTWTDRPKRSDEIGIEHEYISKVMFDQKEKNGFFAHKPFALFNLPYRYAMPLVQVPRDNKVPSFMGRVMIVPALNNIYPERIIYQVEAPYDFVSTRLKNRVKSGAPIGTRLEDYDKEVSDGRKIAQRVFINDGTLNGLFNQVKVAIETDFIERLE